MAGFMDMVQQKQTPAAPEEMPKIENKPGETYCSCPTCGTKLKVVAAEGADKQSQQPKMPMDLGKQFA